MKAWGPLVASLLLLGCGGNNNVASQLIDQPDFEPEGQAKCKVGASQEKPLIVEWPSGERADLEARSRQGGLVVVRYEGCEMQILSRCKAPGAYAYIPVTTKQDTLVIQNEDELYANLPVGAVKLEGKLQSAGSLNVTMTLVGKFAADRFDVVDNELEGACDGATHVVVGMNVGAFEFFAGGSAEVGGGVRVGDTVGAGAKSAAKRETLSRDGNTDACRKASTDDEGPPTGCGASLRLEVAPLAPAETAKTKVGPPPTELVCPAGTTLTDGMCQPKVSRTCPEGMEFASGRGCIPLIAPLQAAALPTKGSPTLGPDGAAVTIQWFGGYQDPYSRLANATLKKVMARYTGQVKLVFRHAPLAFHKLGRPAAYAALEAFAQKGNNGYWKMHEALYALKPLTEDGIRNAAQGLGLDMARFDDAMKRNVHKTKVDEDFALFNAQGFRGTPTFTVNKDIINGSQPVEMFNMAVARAIAGKDGRQLPVPTGVAKVGSNSALVQIHWFGSFQDPATARMAPVIDKLLEAYPKRLSVIWRNHPLPMLDRSRPAARVSRLSVGGRAWGIVRTLLDHPTQLSDDAVVGYLERLHIDEKRVREALAGQDRYDDAVDLDLADAKRFSASQVPTFFVNGDKLEGPQTLPQLKAAVEKALNP